MRYEPVLIKAPSGRYVFVGTIPFDLMYETTDGSPLTRELVTAEHRLPSNLRKRIKSLSWATPEEAFAFAKLVIE